MQQCLQAIPGEDVDYGDPPARLYTWMHFGKVSSGTQSVSSRVLGLVAVEPNRLASDPSSVAFDYRTGSSSERCGGEGEI